MAPIQSVNTKQFIVNSGAPNTEVITGPAPMQLIFVPPLPAAPGQVLASISSPVNGLYIRPGPAGGGNIIWGAQQFLWVIQIDTGNTGIISNPNTSFAFSQNMMSVPHIPLIGQNGAPPEVLQFSFA